MSGETDLETLLGSMDAELLAGSYVFATITRGSALPEAEVLASVVEAEGLSIVVAKEAADRLRLPYDFVAGWITLRIHSALHAVGLTAAVSTALADVGISCNVIAGRHHDHLLVPLERTDDTMEVLRQLAAGNT